MDAMNYHPERNGVVAALDDRTTTTSEIVARHLAGARVVKSFSEVLARDLPLTARPSVASGRLALPIAGDDDAKGPVERLHDALDFDVLDTGPLAEG